MEKKGISQEWLKAFACVTMLIDHVGAVFYPRELLLRVIGRLAFPIYCFLMAEGVYYTRNPKKYALRLFVGLLLSEIPFDIGLFGGITSEHQSVMFTLLIGFVAIELIEMAENQLLKLIVAGAAFALAQVLDTDYGGFGVALIVLLSQSRGQKWLQAIVIAVVSYMMNSFKLPVFGYYIPIEMFAVLAMVPIAFYDGKKSTSSAWIQTGFYLFYPVHLAVIMAVRLIWF